MQRRLVVIIDVSGQPVGPIFMGQAVPRTTTRLAYVTGAADASCLKKNIFAQKADGEVHFKEEGLMTD